MPTPSSQLGLLAGSRSGYGDGYSRFSSTILPLNAADEGVSPDASPADNARGLQAAVDRALSVPGRLGWIFLPPGRIRYSTQLVLPNQAGALRISGAAAGRSFTGGVNGDPTDIFGTELQYEGQSGSAIFCALSGSDRRLYLWLEHFTLLGNRNVAGAVGGSGIHFQVAAATNAILASLKHIHVIEAFDHGFFLDGNVFECQGYDLRSNQNGGRGINIAANGAGIPGEIRLFGVTANANVGRGVHVGGGGHCELYGITASNNLDSGLVIDGAVVEVFGLQVEDFVTPGVLIDGTSGSQVVGLLATYTATPRTLLRFGANAVFSTVRGVRSNSQAGDTDIHTVAGAFGCSVYDYRTNDDVFKTNDEAGQLFMQNGSTYPTGQVVSAESPAALGVGNNNDYDPGIILRSPTWRLSADAAGSTLTGIARGRPGRRLRIINVSANALTLAHQSAASAAANRIISPNGLNVVLTADDCMDMEYDGTTSRWRLVRAAL